MSAPLTANEFAQLPSSEADREAIRKAVAELEGSFTRQQAEFDLQKTITATIKDKTGVKPALLLKFARWHFNDTADRDVTKLTEEEAAYRVLYAPRQDSTGAMVAATEADAVAAFGSQEAQDAVAAFEPAAE